MQEIAVTLFAALTLVSVLFQAGLAIGLPWGAASMGGKYPGVYPPKMRIVAVVNMIILVFLALIVLSRADVILPGMRGFADAAIWVVVGFYLIGIILNSITPSKIERIWVPVVLLQFVAILWIALH